MKVSCITLLCALFLALVCAATQASEQNWLVVIQGIGDDFPSALSRGTTGLGTNANAADSFDSCDQLYDPSQSWDHELGVNIISRVSSGQACVGDYRSPLAPAITKTWQDVRVWNGSFRWNDICIGVYLHNVPATIGGLPARFTLRVLGSVHGGLLQTPVVYTLGPNGNYNAPSADPALVLRFNPRWTDPQSGGLYCTETWLLDFTASVVPEPPSLIALVCGTGAIGGALCRRGKRH